jgi:hypothetical protein
MLRAPASQSRRASAASSCGQPARAKSPSVTTPSVFPSRFVNRRALAAVTGSEAGERGLRAG